MQFIKNLFKLDWNDESGRNFKKRPQISEERLKELSSIYGISPHEINEVSTKYFNDSQIIKWFPNEKDMIEYIDNILVTFLENWKKHTIHENCGGRFLGYPNGTLYKCDKCGDWYDLNEYSHINNTPKNGEEITLISYNGKFYKTIEEALIQNL